MRRDIRIALKALLQGQNAILGHMAQSPYTANATERLIPDIITTHNEAIALLNELILGTQPAPLWDEGPQDFTIATRKVDSFLYALLGSTNKAEAANVWAWNPDERTKAYAEVKRRLEGYRHAGDTVVQVAPRRERLDAEFAKVDPAMFRGEGEQSDGD